MKKYMERLLPSFIACKTKGKTGDNASVYENLFYSYNTIISFVKDGAIYLRNKKFTQTTTRQQNAIREFAKENCIPLIECEEVDFLKTLFETTTKKPSQTSV